MTGTSSICRFLIFAVVFASTECLQIQTSIAATSQSALSNTVHLSPPMRGKVSENTSSAQLDNETPQSAPSIATTLLKTGISKYHSGDMVAAEDLFKAVLRLEPNNTEAYFNLGVIAEKRADLPGALHYYQGALQTKPNDPIIKGAIQQISYKLAAENKVFSENAGQYQSNVNQNGQKSHKQKHHSSSSSTKRLLFTGLMIGAGIALHGGVGCYCHL